MNIKKISTCLLTVTLFGCSATKLDSGAESVIVIPPSQQLPANCKYLGQVTGNQGNFVTGGWTSNATMASGSMNDLRNQASKLGANYVQLLTNQAGDTGGGGFGSGGYQQTNVTNVGNAYSCPKSAAN